VSTSIQPPDSTCCINTVPVEALTTNDVHLWRVAIVCASTPSLFDVLSEEERRRASQYRFDRDRRQFVVAHGVLRLLLEGYTGRSAQSLRFTHNEHGKPSLDGGVQFNLSHAADVALIAVSRMEVGIDIEQVEPDCAWQDIAQHFFTQAERDCIGAEPEARRAEAFFRCWTRREAYAKARGLGLSTEAAFGINTPVEADGRWWSTREFEPRVGYVGAITCDGDFKLEFYDWRSELAYGAAADTTRYTP
jgi:4'-phosphopantetheinyl transferase